MEVIPFIVLIMAVPVAVMVCLTPRGRVIAFVLGLVFTWDVLMVAWFSQQPRLELFALPGALISLAALLVEAPAFVVRTVRRAASGPKRGKGAQCP